MLCAWGAQGKLFGEMILLIRSVEPMAGSRSRQGPQHVQTLEAGWKEEKFRLQGDQEAEGCRATLPDSCC